MISSFLFCTSPSVSPVHESSPQNTLGPLVTPRSSTCCGVCSLSNKAHFQIELSISHIQGSDNTQADAISRNQLPLFLSQVPEAEPSPRPMSPALVALSTGLDFARLGTVVQELFSSRLANSTLRSYRSGTTKYYNSCTSYKVPALPATERVVCFFVAKLYLDGVAGSLVKTYVLGRNTLFSDRYGFW